MNCHKAENRLILSESPPEEKYLKPWKLEADINGNLYAFLAVLMAFSVSASDFYFN